MKEFIKTYYKNIILCAIYTIIAELVYCVWLQTQIGKWWVTLLIGFGVLACAALFSFFYLKDCMKEKEAKKEEPKLENNVIEEVKETPEAEADNEAKKEE